MRCKCGAEMTSHGFPGHNQRFDCTKCNRVKIPASSKGRTNNWIFPVWTTKEEYYPDWLQSKDKKPNDLQVLKVYFIGEDKEDRIYLMWSYLGLGIMTAMGILNIWPMVGMVAS